MGSRYEAKNIYIAIVVEEIGMSVYLNTVV